MKLNKYIILVNLREISGHTKNFRESLAEVSSEAGKQRKGSLVFAIFLFGVCGSSERLKVAEKKEKIAAATHVRAPEIPNPRFYRFLLMLHFPDHLNRM